MRSKYKNLGRTLVAAVVAGGLAGCVTTQSEKPDFYPAKGSENTMIYTNDSGKEVVVYDLRGRWEADYPSEKEIVIIDQENYSFKGTKTKGSSYVYSGEKTIKGIIKGNLVNCSIFHSQNGWDFGNPKKIGEKGNSFECYGHGHTLEFKRLNN